MARTLVLLDVRDEDSEDEIAEAILAQLGDEVDKVFCPTGEGGGIDPTCSPPGNSKIPDDVYFPGEKVDMHKMEGGMLRRLRENVARGGSNAEEAAIIDNDGILKHSLLGEVGSVNIPEEIIQDAREASNWVLTHTHPNGPVHNNGGALSLNDIRAAIGMNLYEIRAVSQGPLGRFEFSLKRPQRGWPSKYTVWSVYDAQRVALEPAFAKHLQQGKISPGTLNLAFSHAIMVKTARKLKLDYKMKRHAT